MNRFIKEKNKVVYSFKVFNDYEDFGKVEEVLRKYYCLNVTKRLDGPYSRILEFEIGHSRFELYNDDSYGTELSTELINEKLLIEIVQKGNF